MITGIIQEEWRSISGYANYQVSNIGRVRNIKSGRILKPGSDIVVINMLIYFTKEVNRNTKSIDLSHTCSSIILKINHM